MTNFAPTSKSINRQDPRVILRRLDGARFVFPQRRELGVLTGKARMEDLMLHLHDAHGNFVCCYLAYQLPFIGFKQFNRSIQVVMAPGQQEAIC